MALDTRMTLSLSATATSALDLVAVSAPLSVVKNVPLTNGTGANQADKVFSDQRTLSASSSESLDLAGSLTDAFGATITFARIKLIMISASSANANNVLVGGAASNQFINWVGDATDVVVIRPGGVFLLAAADATAYAVTAATGDLLKVANSGSGTSVTYDVVLIGASA